MHLGLNRPFVPHVNQRSPEAPVKFQMALKLREPCSSTRLQMAPMLSFLLFSGSKKKEPRYVCLSEVKASLRLKNWVTSGFTKVFRYAIHFPQKFRQANPPQVPQKAPIKWRPAYRAFAYLSKTSSFRFPGKGALPEATSMEPLERAIPHPQTLFIQLSKSPVDECSSRFPKSGAAMNRDARLQSLF